MSLTRLLYRQLLRVARTHDRHPCLKGSLDHPRVQYKMERALEQLQERMRDSTAGVRLVKSGPGSGIIINVGKQRSPQAIASLIQNIVAEEIVKHRGAEEEGEGERKEEEDEADEEEDEEEKDATHDTEEADKDASEDPHKPPPPLKSDAEFAKEADGGWSESVSPAQARWMNDFFKGGDHYTPYVSLTELVKREFRRALPTGGNDEHTAAASSTGATATSASASATTKHSTTAAHSHHSAPKKSSSGAVSRNHPVDPRTQLTSDTFAVYRTLNKNLSEGIAKKLLLREEDVREDPMFADPARAPLAPAGASSSGAAADLRMRPLPLSALRRGTFIVSHPQLDGNVFGRTVILLYRHSARRGAAGLIINKPFHVKPNTLADGLKRSDIILPRGIRALEPLHSAALHDGGPVSGSYGVGVSPLHILHRHPLLARLAPALPVIEDTPYPVWYMPAEDCQQIAAELLKFDDLTPHASAPSLSRPLFSPSDFIAYDGHAEWYPGQLEAELRRGSWMLVEGSGAHIFNSPALEPAAAADPTVHAAVAAEGPRKEAQRKKALEMVESPDSYPLRLQRPFSMPLLWGHAMHVHGGECRHWAHWPGDGTKQAVLQELLQGRPE